MSTSNLTLAPKNNQYQIVIEVRPGNGQAAFFVDVWFRVGNRYIKILGCPVWRGNAGELNPDLPKKQGTKNPSKRFPILEVDQELWREISHAIRVACEEYRQAERNA